MVNENRSYGGTQEPAIPAEIVVETVPGTWYDESGAMPLVRGLLMQFRLSTLMLAFVVVAAALGLFGGWGILVAAVLLWITAYVRRAETRRQAALHATLFLAVVATVAFCYLVQRLVDVSHNVACRCHFLQVGLALQNYEKSNGCFPPAYQLDANSTPVHSWRALLMPYLDIAGISYNLNAPWNAPGNSKLIDLMDFRFACPEDRIVQRPGMTSYVAVVGPNTAWPGATSRKWDDLPAAHLHAQVLLVEVADSGIKWAEPRDLSLEEALAGAGNEPRLCISSKHMIPGDFFFRDSPRGRNGVFRRWHGSLATTEPASRFPRSPAGRGRRRRPQGEGTQGTYKCKPVRRIHWPELHRPRGPRSVHRRAPVLAPRFCRRAARPFLPSG